MKRLWIAVVIFVAVTVGCVGALFWQRALLNDLERQVIALEHTVQRNGKGALEQVDAFEQSCYDAIDKITCFSRHVDSFPLKESVKQLRPLLQAEEYAHFYAETGRCRFYISELRRAEKPILSNIF